MVSPVVRLATDRASGTHLRRTAAKEVLTVDDRGAIRRAHRDKKTSAIGLGVGAMPAALVVVRTGSPDARQPDRGSAHRVTGEIGEFVFGVSRSTSATPTLPCVAC